MMVYTKAIEFKYIVYLHLHFTQKRYTCIYKQNGKPWTLQCTLVCSLVK